MKELLEGYIEQGYNWIYSYSNRKDLMGSRKDTTRLFVDEPWFSIEGGMTWVDVKACFGKPNSIMIELDIEQLKEPIKIQDYIKTYINQ